jgi:uncharacterized membrane protein YqjE
MGCWPWEKATWFTAVPASILIVIAIVFSFVGGVQGVVVYCLYLAALLFAIRSAHGIAPLSFRLPCVARPISTAPVSPNKMLTEVELGGVPLREKKESKPCATKVLGGMFGVAALLFTVCSITTLVMLVSIDVGLKLDEGLVLVLLVIGALAATATCIDLFSSSADPSA